MDLGRIDHMPSIKTVMTPFPYAVDIDDPVTRAEEIMREHGLRHVPVEEAGELVGVATHRDIALLVNPALDAKSRARIRVRSVCTLHPYVVDLNASLAEVLFEMAGRHIGSTLVVRKGKLVGIFTVTDACRTLGAILKVRFRRDGDDAA